jgi:hypothetical protein
MDCTLKRRSQMKTISLMMKNMKIQISIIIEMILAIRIRKERSRMEGEEAILVIRY